MPVADFRSGRLEQLPVEDESVDLITCALVLTHVESLEPVMREFVRFLRPGVQAIQTDIHPVATMTGTIAAFLDRDVTGGIPYVRNLTHQVGEYVTVFLARKSGVVEPLANVADPAYGGRSSIRQRGSVIGV